MMHLSQLLPEVIRIAKQAGAFIDAERAGFQYDSVQQKGVNDLVSYVDRKAEQIIIDGLNEVFPDSGFIAEENTVSRIADFNWIIDPLDGTTNFIHHLPCYAVSIGLEHKGDILLGVVYEVARKECFSASKGGGAFLNEVPIKVSGRTTVSESLVGTGFPVVNFDRLEEYLEAAAHFMRSSHGVRRMGAASADLCFLACGRLDAFFEYNLKPWDVAAGACIVKEAGGSIGDFSGGDNWLHGKEIIATNGHVEKEFTALVNGFFNRGGQ